MKHWSNLLKTAQDMIDVMRLIVQKLKQKLGWQPKHAIDRGLKKTVEWYLSNDEWLDDINGRFGIGYRQGNISKQ